jgi:hypothetical protein
VVFDEPNTEKNSYTSREAMPIANDGALASTAIPLLSSMCSTKALDIDDVRIYSVALSDRQIENIHEETAYT